MKVEVGFKVAAAAPEEDVAEAGGGTVHVLAVPSAEAVTRRAVVRLTPKPTNGKRPGQHKISITFKIASGKHRRSARVHTRSEVARLKRE